MIAYTCPHCSHRLRIPDRYAGQEGVCAKCKQPIIVPQSSPPKVTHAANPEEVQELIKKLFPPSWQVWVSGNTRHEAAIALGKTGSKEAIPPLVKALDEQDPALYTAAAEALGTLALDAPQTETRVAALATLEIVIERRHEALIRDHAVGKLVEAFSDPEPAVQKKAVLTMQRVLMMPQFQEAEPAFLPLCRQALILLANADPDSDLGREAIDTWGMAWVTHAYWNWIPQSAAERRIAVRGLLSVIERGDDPECVARAEKMMIARVGNQGLEWLEEAATSAGPNVQEIIKKITDIILGRQEREAFDPTMRRVSNSPATSDERRRMIAESLSKDHNFFEEQKKKAEVERLASEDDNMFSDF